MPNIKSFIKFRDYEEKMLFLQKYKLVSKNPKKEPVFYYKGRRVQKPMECEILGYEKEYSDSATLVIDYGNGPLFIHSGFFKQMQGKNFNIDIDC